MKTPIEKGMLVSPGDWWFVVVRAVYDSGKLHLYCICDNANNRYSFSMDEITHCVTLRDVGHWEYLYERPELPPHLVERGFPHDVIVEVLSGKHDDRFSDWEGRD